MRTTSEHPFGNKYVVHILQKIYEAQKFESHRNPGKMGTHTSTQHVEQIDILQFDVPTFFVIALLYKPDGVVWDSVRFFP
jgi:hypothetical protein